MFQSLLTHTFALWGYAVAVPEEGVTATSRGQGMFTSNEMLYDVMKYLM